MGHSYNLFNGPNDNTLIKRITPTQEQIEFLQTQWNDLADHLKQKLYAAYGYPISTWLQGSYKFATLIRPVHLGEEYDVDVGIYFEWEDKEDESYPTPKELRDWVQQELVIYKSLTEAIKQIEEPPKERCSRAIYSKQFHIDAPVYHLQKSSDTRRLACLSGDWELSDPKKIYKWFRDAVKEGDRDQLRRLVRYFKAWAAVAFEDSPKARPSSILLTVLVTNIFKDSFFSRLAGMDDEDALIMVIKDMHKILFANRKVENPVDSEEDLNRIPDEHWRTFLNNLESLYTTAQKAEDSEDEASAALAWSEVFSFLMPLPETKEVEILEENSGNAVMQLPEIEIDVFTRNPRRFLNKYNNEVSSVFKDCDLIFRITNPHVIPAYATIEWTVRNDGQESDDLGDLGHRRIGVRMFEADEHTAYAGLHYMDCVVRLNGQVYSVRRVPVNVRDIDYPQRNPPRPSYTRILSRIGRRR